MSPCCLLSRASLRQSFLSNDLVLRLVESTASPLRSNIFSVGHTAGDAGNRAVSEEDTAPDLVEFNLAGNQRVNK